MIRKIPGLIFFIVFFLMGNPVHAENQPGKKVVALLEILENYHYQPPVCDSSFSDQIFDGLINYLDPLNLLFTQESVSGLIQFKNSLCFQNETLATEFITQLTSIYKKQINTADSILAGCFNTSFSFSDNDSLAFSKNDKIFPKDDSELELRWKKWVKYNMLKSLLFSSADTLISGEEIPDSLLSVDSTIAQKIKLKEKRRLNQLLNCSEGVDEFVLNSFLNTITTCFDPHSTYFSEREKEKFEASLSKENYAFGFSLGKNINDEVIIQRIMPDSPAWYSKDLDEGDVLVKIKMSGEEETDLAFSDLQEIDAMFENLDGNKVELTLRNDQEEKKVVLYKSKFDTKENQSFSFMLEGDKKVGYIWFSQFYTEFGQAGNNGCSTDVLREIVKLKEDGMEAMILDLRNNPGGSEYEALKIVGYLAGNGNYAIRKNKSGFQMLLKNEDAKNWYDGPLLVLVNGNSASASEMLSAIFQDYNRAVILGEPTFGKATEQLVLPVGQKLRSNTGFNWNVPEEKFGFVKMTSGKIYRITGKSYQKEGVKPDLYLPDIYSSEENREQSMPFSLENDSIVPDFLFQVLPALPIDALAELSYERIVASERFKKVTWLKDTLQTIRNREEAIPLNYFKFKADNEQSKKFMEVYEELTSEQLVDFKIRNTLFDEESLKSDTLQLEIREKFKQVLLNDVYMNESYKVALDLFRLMEKEKIKP